MQPISLHTMRVYATWKRIFPRCRQNDAHSASHSARSIHPRNHGCNHAVRDAWSARFLRCLPVDCPRSTLVTSSKLGDSLPVVCVHYAGHTWSVHARNPRFTFNRLRMFTWTRVPSFLTRFQQLSRCVPHSCTISDDSQRSDENSTGTFIRSLVKNARSRVFFNSRVVYTRWYEATGDWLIIEWSRLKIKSQNSE